MFHHNRWQMKQYWHDLMVSNFHLAVFFRFASVECSRQNKVDYCFSVQAFQKEDFSFVLQLEVAIAN